MRDANIRQNLPFFQLLSSLSSCLCDLRFFPETAPVHQSVVLLRMLGLEDRIRQSGMPVENAERVMRAYNRSFAVAIRQLQSLSLDALLAIELEEEASQMVVDRWC